jgi:hypothetical protein
MCTGTVATSTAALFADDVARYRFDCFAIFSGYTPHRSAPNRSAQSRRLLYLSYNALSDGGDQRDPRYAEFRGWLQDRYAEYGKTSTFFR